MKILVFGNPLVSRDSIALRLVPRLRKAFPSVEFREFDAAENLEGEGRDLIILDSAQGVDGVVVLRGLDRLGTGRVYSMHDFDLALTLKLMKKMGMIDTVTIIAVRSSMSAGKAFEGVRLAISSLLSGSG